MELVYPIYLDIPMMTGFLASLKDGLVDKADIEERTGKSKEKSGSFSLGAKISGILSGLVGGEAKGDVSGKSSNNLETLYRSTIQYPTTSLFIELRSLLKDQKNIKNINSKNDLLTASLGDIIEFQGAVKPSPSYQTRMIFNQLLPILDAAYNVVDSQFDQTLQVVENAKFGEEIDVSGQKMSIQNKQQKTALQDTIKAMKKLKQSEFVSYKTIGEALNTLLPENSVESLVVEIADTKILCRVRPEYVRDKRIQDIYSTSWKCIGKVISVIKETERFDLWQGSPISYFAKDQFPGIAKLLQNDKMNVEVASSDINGPSVILETMAIFS